MRDSAELHRSCVGQPDPATLLKRMVGGTPACSNSLECRYWDEAEKVWSTEGCRTVVYSQEGSAEEGVGVAGGGGSVG